MVENKSLIMEAVEDLNLVLKRLPSVDLSELDLEESILDNRIISLEGYLRFLERDGISELEKIVARAEDDYYD